MGMLKFEIPHGLPKDEARTRVERLLCSWSEKHGIQARWQGDQATLSGKIMGITLDGQLEVRDGRVGGEATDPGFLLRERARKYLIERFTECLDPAHGEPHD